MRKWITVLFILFIALSPITPVFAANQGNITITATGNFTGIAPATGFAILYMDDTHLKGVWNIGANVDIVELRYDWNRYPTDRTDGTLIYTGNDTFADMSIDITAASVPYFRIWSRSATTGVWELTGSSAKGDFMTQSWAWMILLLYAIGMSIIPFMFRLFFGNPVTKTLTLLSLIPAWLALVIFMNDSRETGFMFSFDPMWAKLWIFSVFAFIGNIITVVVGTTIDKGGRLTLSTKDVRTRSQRVQDDYKRTLRGNSGQLSSSEKYRKQLRERFQ